MTSQPNRSTRKWLIVWAIVGITSCVLILACAGVLLLVRARGGPGAAASSTNTPGASLQVDPTFSATATRTPLPAQTATPTGTPTSTRENTSTGTPPAAPEATTEPAGTPTPIVCDDPQALNGQTLLPGQQFTCTFKEEDLNDQLSQQPDIPCTQLTVTMADGQIFLTCFMGFRLTAIAEVEARDCEMAIEIVGGTMGFADAVQQMLQESDGLIPYDQICVQEATVGEGEIVIKGYGR